MGERTGVMYRIGQKVKIKVENSDPVTRAIDFSLGHRQGKDPEPERPGSGQTDPLEDSEGQKTETGPIRSRQRTAQKDRKRKRAILFPSRQKSQREKGQRQKEVS